jgi:glycosyl transferase family protein
MSERVLLSVIIPVYNGAETIARCLDTLVAIPEATGRLEIIMINDGSTDETLAVLESYKVLYPYLSIQVISQINQGQSFARNKGLALATGEYIWFVDADDWVDSEIAGYLLSLVAEASYDMLCFGVRNRGDRGEDVSYGWMDTSLHDFEKLTHIDGTTLLTKYNLSGSVCPFFWRRNLLEAHQAHFVGGILHEDALFYWHYTAYAEHVLLIPRVAYYYYQRADSSIHTPGTLQLRAFSRLEGALRLLQYAEEIPSLRHFYLVHASTNYRLSLRMIACYGTFSELKSYTSMMKQKGDYKLLMRYAGRKGAPLIYLAHRDPWLFNLIAHILPPVA